MNELYSVKYSSDSLQHFGILGQKWGKRNGPPYPLGSDQKSAKEKSMASSSRKSLSKSSSESYKKSDHKELTDEQKRNIKIAVGIGVGIAATVGTVYLVKSGKFKMLSDSGRKVVGNMLSSNKTTLSHSSSIINPLNKMKKFIKGSTMNCGNCVAADELRHRGLNVRARLNKTGMYAEQLATLFNGINSDTFLSFKASDLITTNEIDNADWDKSIGDILFDNLQSKVINNYPDGSRGSIMVPTWFGGHFMSWNIKDGKLLITNPQDDSLNPISVLSNFYDGPGSLGVRYGGLQLMRMDNLEINTSKINDFVEDINLHKLPSLKEGPFNINILETGNAVMLNMPESVMDTLNMTKHK